MSLEGIFIIIAICAIVAIVLIIVYDSSEGKSKSKCTDCYFAHTLNADMCHDCMHMPRKDHYVHWNDWRIADWFPNKPKKDEG